MLWITYEPIPVVYHYLKGLYASPCIEVFEAGEIDSLVKRPTNLSVSEDGKFQIERSHCLIDYKKGSSLPNYKGANDIYICSLDRGVSLKGLTYKELGVDLNYGRNAIKDTAFILDDQAYKYLLDKYSKRPYKLIYEVDALLLLFIRKKSKLSLEEVMEVCGSEPPLVVSYLQFIGTKEGSRIILSLSKSDAWLTVDYLHQYLVTSNKCPELYAYISPFLIDIREGRLDPKYGLAYINELIIQSTYIDRTNKSNWNIDIRL